MLKTQNAENEPQPAGGVGRTRVTPEELTKALAVIESRKQAEASRLAGTIPLEEAVAEMHLDSTPEEIWAEVQSQRVQKGTPDVRPSTEAAPAVAPRSHPNRRWLRIAAPLLLLGVGLRLVAPSRPHHPAAHASAPMTQDLAQVPDGKEVYADSTALIQASEGKPLTQIRVSADQSGNRWGLIKVAGHLYLRGYILKTASLRDISGKPLNVYNDDNSGELRNEQTSNITLRVDKIPLQKSGGDDDFSSVTVPNFQPDSLTTLSPWR